MESFKSSDVVAHFNTLKASGAEKWWNEYVVFEWNKIRLGKNSTKWITIKYTPVLNIKHKRFNIVIRNETHSGQIMPNTPEEVVELKAKFPDSRIELRTMKPSLQFQQWSRQVQTQEDRITPLYDEKNNMIVPDEQYRSTYYQIAQYIDEIFKYEMKERVNRGTFMMVYLNQNKGVSIEELKSKIGHVNDCDTIIRDDDAITIREKYPTTFQELLKGMLTVSSTKIGSIIQERISDKAIKNKGAKLPNPMTRVTIPFDAKTGQSLATILDKDKPFKCNGKKGYETATVNNEQVNAKNIHQFIPSRSVIDGIINMDSICFSQLGISLPVKASMIIVQQPSKRENNILSICNEIYGSDDEKSDDEKSEPNDTPLVTQNTVVYNDTASSSKTYNEALLSALNV